MPKKKNENFDDFDDINKIFSEIMKNFAEMFSEDMDEFNQPIVYGFNIHFDKNKKPKIEEFGNLQLKEKKINDVREPLVDVLAKDDTISIIAEVPGASPQDIKILAMPKSVIIDSTKGVYKFFKEIELPARVDPSSGKASLNNGVLEITLKKSLLGTGKKEINIE